MITKDEVEITNELKGRCLVSSYDNLYSPPSGRKKEEKNNNNLA